MNDRPQLNPMLKLALDLGPLLLFFFANARPALFEPWIAPLIPAAVATGERAGIFVATAVFMVAILAALVISYALTRRLPVMAVVSAVIVVVFGGATLFFQNETFIKLKPTIIYLMFTGTLFGGLIFRKPLLAMVFDQMFHLTEEGWRKLTIRWALFFLALAVLNEIVWRTQSTDTWVTFKVFGVMPLTFIFAALQYPLLMKHTVEEEKNSAPKARRRASALGRAFTCSLLEVGRHLAAVRGELLHHLLVQPDVHRRRIVHVAGVAELLGELLARAEAAVEIRAASSDRRSTCASRASPCSRRRAW